MTLRLKLGCSDVGSSEELDRNHGTFFIYTISDKIYNKIEVKYGSAN